MIIILSVALLLLNITTLITSIWLWNVLGNVEQILDNMLESLESLKGSIKHELNELID